MAKILTYAEVITKPMWMVVNFWIKGVYIYFFHYSRLCVYLSDEVQAVIQISDAYRITNQE